MGRLSLVLPDHNNRLTMWDFAGNPTGVLAADSTTTFELRPHGWSGQAAHDIYGPGGLGERQSFAGQEARMGYEVWRRTTSTAFGVIGDLSGLTVNTPYNDSQEIRGHYSDPDVMVVLNGKMPYILTQRMRWALRASGSSQSVQDDYRLITSNSTGQYLDEDGQLLPAPNIFNPDESHVRRTAYGVGLSYDFASWMNLALVGVYASETVTNQNEGDRYVTKYEGKVPYDRAGELDRSAGCSFEFSADGHWWSSDSKSNYVFTSSRRYWRGAVAGAARPPHERRAFFRPARPRTLAVGAFEVGGAFGVEYSGNSINPADQRLQLVQQLQESPVLQRPCRLDRFAGQRLGEYLGRAHAAVRGRCRVAFPEGGAAPPASSTTGARQTLDRQLTPVGERQLWDVRWGSVSVDGSARRPPGLRIPVRRSRRSSVTG
jgi:hypothetical protein